MTWRGVDLANPDWLGAIAPPGTVAIEPEARMRVAIALARANAERGGGPFGAAVFDRGSGRLVAPGVNRVVAANASLAHAEIMALAGAQQRLGAFDLGREPGWDHELVTTAEPCIQCFGALFWSGVRSLVCGAPTEAAETSGFDEGPKPEDWAELLEARGIQVRTGVLGEEAAAVIRDYVAGGGPIYNPTRP